MRKRSDAAREALIQAAQHASDAGRRLVEIGSAIQDRAYEALRARHQRSGGYAVRLRDHASDYPLTATFATVGVAVAVGALLTAWLARR
jgi:hypothetical protein